MIGSETSGQLDILVAISELKTNPSITEGDEGQTICYLSWLSMVTFLQKR